MDNRSTHSPEERTVQPTTWFKVLADPQRQFFLSYLSRRPDTMSLDKLAEQVARWNGKSLPTTRLSLHHTDLPKLAEIELVRYDAEQGTVGRTSMTGRAVTLLYQARSIER